MNYIFIHHALPEEMVSALSVYGRCIPLPPFTKLPHPVSGHPDMLMANIGGTLIVHRGYTVGQKILCENGIPFEISHTPVGKEYPDDVRLNCFTADFCFFANAKAISAEARCLAENKNFRFISVKQGYAKCASAVAGGAIATADTTIAKAASREGIPTLLLKPHFIGIEVYDTGFIGGTCVAIENKLLFFGKIEAYPQYEELRDFFAQHGITLVSLGDKPIFDYGGAIIYEI